MSAWEGAAEKRELDELRKKHSVSKSRATRISDDMEQGNKALREMLDAYKQADTALERSRRS